MENYYIKKKHSAVTHNGITRYLMIFCSFRNVCSSQILNGKAIPLQALRVPGG
jgi:hypothetical protein